ncbi:nucleoprotein [Nyando virus]|uniref:Nucleoprotein n=1 Tax=Nyando virus TaxID=35316 RepID=A0A088MJ24_9VIRU|nr:nucleoprotein [Nyando virus]AIN37044.1 nucleoprotein [Nyando virus]AIN37046.1 nucleoprotein [Nyando virus]
MSELVFYDVEPTAQNGFDPDKQYVAFKASAGAGLNIVSARIFFLNARKAKDQLARRPEPKVGLKFGTWQVEVVNNHFQGNRDNPIGDSDLTMHRLSGYIARYILDQYLAGNSVAQAGIQLQIINPIAESNGIKWSAGAEVYLSFFPGTEMFLEKFNFYPLAIGIYRVKKGMMEAQFLKKSLRQRYGQMTADQWMQTKSDDVMRAVAVLEKLSWGRSGLSEAARQFLGRFGIVI